MKKFPACFVRAALLLLATAAVDGAGTGAPGGGVLTREVQVGRVTVETRALSGAHEEELLPAGHRR